MAGTKEIRVKIASIKSTQKITKAMEMVAASKMRRAQDRMHAARPYAEKIRNVVAHLGYANPEYKHPYLVPRKEVKRLGIIIVSTDRGLCGGLNANLFRETLRQMRKWEEEGKEMDLCTIGSKASAFFNRIGAKIIGQATHIGDQPTIEQLIGTVMMMLKAYTEGNIDELYIASNRFVNSMTQTPKLEKLIPVAAGEDKAYKHHWDYIYEPDAKQVIDELLVRYVEALIYQAVAENMASEQSARMVAMKSASDNAGNVINELQMIYNKTRQAAITKEISEIVGGAAAV